MIYCVVPRELAPKLHDPLRRHFHDDPGVEVVVERRARDRRMGLDRRAEAGAAEPATERRRIRNLEGRRVGDRRAALVEVQLPALPRKARPHADRLHFVERVAPTVEQDEDADTARLVTRIQAGYNDGFADLYLRYFDRVYGYLLIALRDRHEAEDLTQQVFVKVLEALSTYERRRQPFRAWLFTIVRHVAIAHLNRQRRMTPEDPAELARRRESAAPDGEHDEQVLSWIADRELLLFVERLPASQRQVLVMRFMLDLPPREIAEILGTTSDVVRQHQARAIRSLRTRLAGIGRVPQQAKRAAPMRRGIRQAQVLRARRFSLTGRC
jgi:RNA polymerase sigma-70 factor (ECF subfamily)